MKRVLKLFINENSVRGASIILVITLALSNILGLLRDRFLTKNILTSDLDIYYAAFRIPDLIFNFLILGAIASAFIPIFSEFITKKREKEAFKIANSLISLATFALIVSAIVFYFLMPYVMPAIVPSFESDRLNQAVHYSRLLMLAPIFFSASYIIGGILNSYKRFFAYALSPLFYNASIIVGAAYFAPKYGLISVVYAVIIGSVLHLLIQVPSTIKLGFSFRPSFIWNSSPIKRIITLMIPRTVGMGANQLMLVVFTAVASTLTAGSIAAFNLANNIQTVPSVVFGSSFAIAVFPTLASKISIEDKESFITYLSKTIRTVAFLLIPSSVVFILLRAQIVRLILGSGKFGWDDTKKTALALGLFSVSILAQGLIPLLARAFYAFKNTRTPMYVAIISAVVSIVLSFFFKKLGVAGLALAFSIGSFINAFLLFGLIGKTYRALFNRKLLLSLIKITLISLVMGAAIWGSMHAVAPFVDMTRFVGVLEQSVIACLVGAIVFFGLSRLFNCDEMKWAITRKINGANGVDSSTE